MSDYTLPRLPYDVGALEPHHSAEVLQPYHDKHHAAYVSGATPGWRSSPTPGRSASTAALGCEYFSLRASWVPQKNSPT